MEKKIRKISLLCTTAVMACSLVLGAGITALPKTVSAETASMASIIGKKTDNVTVTAGVTKGDHLGLQIGSGLMKEDWSAQIDATFTGSTSISYLLPNMASNEDVWTEKYDGYQMKNGEFVLDEKGNKKPAINYGRQANAFSVRKTNGDLVATFVTVPKAWGSIGNQSAYFYNAITNTYTAPYHHWDGSNGVDYWKTPMTYRTLDPVTDGAYGANYVTQSLSAMCISPSMGVTTVAEGKLDSGNAEGTLYFDYADGALTVSTSSYDFADRKLETQRGNGQVIPMGTVAVDLSDGYVIEMHNAPDFGKDGDVNYWLHNCSSSVLLTTITTEGSAFDTLASEVELTASDATISYVGEKVVDDKNVITVAYGEKLNDFATYQPATATNETSQTIALNGYKGSFAYADNKAFTADEDIVVSNGTVSKNYTVEVIMPSIDTTKLLTALNADTKIRAASTPLYNDQEANAAFNDTANGGYNPFTGTALVVGGHTSTKKTIGAKLSSTLFGNSSITYVAQKNTNVAANAFVIEDAQGNKVLHVINVSAAWSPANGMGKAFVYDYGTQKYTTSNYTTSNVDTTGTKEITAYTSAVQCAPTYVKGWNVAYDFATLSFNYDETAKQMTITTTRRDEARTVITLGVVAADLSNGYTLSIITPNQLTEGCFDVINTTSWTSPAVLITEINGVDTTGLTAAATACTKEVVCENGAEVAMGEELTFKSNSVYNFGSLAYKGSNEVTVDTAADVSKPGETVAVVSDWAGTYEIPVTVKTLGASFTGVEMVKGGFIRMGTAADGSDKGIGFKMNVSAADKALIDAYVGEGKAYTAISYGMIIMPYSYVAQHGDVNAETLFGDTAVYTWDKKEGAGSVPVVQMETENLKASGDAGYIFGAVTELKASTVTTDLIGVGYVKLVDANGEEEYVVVSAYSDTTDDANNNIRTAFEVAKAVYEDVNVTNEEHKKWLLDNYLTPNGYVVA